MSTLKGYNPGTPNLRDALKRAQELGAKVTWPRRTGEVLIEFDGIGKVKHNARRKDASRALLALIRNAERRLLH